MAKGKVKLLAQEWREYTDAKSGELIMEPGFTSSQRECCVVATPIPGTDPVQFEYSCQSITCAGNTVCVLKTHVQPDGTTVHFCKCEPAGAVAAGGARKVRKKAH